MIKKKYTYQERAEQLAKTVDIADKIVRNSQAIPEENKIHFLKWGQQVKHMALNPEPQYRYVVSLKYLENDFLTFWNESSGEEIDVFWIELSKEGINFQRTDTIKTVLKRNRIKSIHEYDNIKDAIVVAEQTGRINKDQAIQLDVLIMEFEERQAKRAK
ncbi:hypothetical protein [Pontibacter pamirensis]|uniref:hypothetical protein n=1 Tax=Pontibacter pamirensis TaxID=2562824 RepID=UPI0013897F8A|nr:hypothetical protein [Pontibacter pamirensis]